MLSRVDVVIDALEVHFRDTGLDRDGSYSHNKCDCGDRSAWLEAHIAEKVLDALDGLEREIRNATI